MNNALIGRKACGCAVAVDFDVDQEARRDMELKGYLVEEVDDDATPVKSILKVCPHGHPVLVLHKAFTKLKAELLAQQSDPAWVIRQRDELAAEVAALKAKLQQVTDHVKTMDADVFAESYECRKLYGLLDIKAPGIAPPK